MPFKIIGPNIVYEPDDPRPLLGIDWDESVDALLDPHWLGEHNRMFGTNYRMEEMTTYDIGSILGRDKYHQSLKMLSKYTHGKVDPVIIECVNRLKRRWRPIFVTAVVTGAEAGSKFDLIKNHFPDDPVWIGTEKHLLPLVGQIDDSPVQVMNLKERRPQAITVSPECPWHHGESRKGYTKLFPSYKNLPMAWRDMTAFLMDVQLHG